MNNLDHSLRRRQALHHFDANGARLDFIDKVLDNLVVDVGFQQRQANLAHGDIDVTLCQLPLARQPVEDTL
jgi:hypothetical protein